MNEVATILNVAKLTRHEFEHFVFSLSSFSFEYSSLQGACGIASLTLAKTLRRLKIPCDFAIGVFDGDACSDPNHCWVEIPRHDMILDITATQFGKKYSPVHVTSFVSDLYTRQFKNANAVRELSEWGAQSHIGREDSLKEITRRVIKDLKRSKSSSSSLDQA